MLGDLPTWLRRCPGPGGVEVGQGGLARLHQVVAAEFLPPGGRRAVETVGRPLVLWVSSCWKYDFYGTSQKS